MKKYGFLVAAILLFLLQEWLLRLTNPVARLPFFPMNDYEITLAIHGTNVFANVFFGNSAVVSAFREEESTSGYVEFGLNWGKATYMHAMLERGDITVNQSLVLGLNIFTLMDTLDSDPSYIWHMGHFEPYAFFYRDRIKNFITGALDNLLQSNFYIRRYESLEKYLYFGMLSDEQMYARLGVLEERFWGMLLSDFENNLMALERIAIFCYENDIRLRVVWMPFNPFSPKPELYERVMEEANRIFDFHGIEVLDLSNGFSRENFFDTGHFNDEFGAGNFTRELIYG